MPDSDTSTVTISTAWATLIILVAIASLAVWIASMVIGWTYFLNNGQTTVKARTVFIWLLIATVGIILPPVYLVGAIGTLVVIES